MMILVAAMTSCRDHGPLTTLRTYTHIRAHVKIHSLGKIERSFFQIWFGDQTYANIHSEQRLPKRVLCSHSTPCSEEPTNAMVRAKAPRVEASMGIHLYMRKP